MARLPKGPSNSANMGATPGTQQTAQRNVAVGGLNPNMPRGPQVQRQAASPYQQSLRGQGPVARPGGQALPQRPAQPSRQPTRQPSRGPVGDREVSGRTVTRGSAMDAGRGYNIFQGMSTPEIVSSNREMGMSNMTALPSLVPEANNRYLNPGRQQLLQPLDYSQESKNKFNKDNLKEAKQEYGAVGDLEEATESGTHQREDPKEFTPYVPSQSTDNISKQEENISYMEDLINDEVIGIDPDKKAAAEEKVSYTLAQQLQSTLSGIDRAMAMNGTFGSGAHSFALNNATAEAMKIWADKSVALDIMDIEQAEVDQQQMIENLSGLTDDYADIERQWMEWEASDQNAETINTEKEKLIIMAEANLIAQAEMYSEDFATQIADAITHASEFTDGGLSIAYINQLSALMGAIKTFIANGGDYGVAQDMLTDGLDEFYGQFEGQY